MDKATNFFRRLIGMLGVAAIFSVTVGAFQATEPMGDIGPVWSPVSNEIAFDSNRNGDSEIVVMNLDNGRVTQLTDNKASDLSPQWSPDGSRLAFYSSRDGNFEIYVMRSDGLELRRLTDHTAIDWHPAWSPTGTRLVFESWREGQADLYVVDFENDTLTRLTNTPQRESHPTWSMNGIAFGSLRNGEWGIYLLDPLSSDAKPILTGLGIDPKPVWSADGEWLVYTAIDRGNLDIHMINRDGQQHQAVTRDTFQDDFATWSTDGKYVAYSSNRDGDWRIFIREVTLP